MAVFVFRLLVLVVDPPWVTSVYTYRQNFETSAHVARSDADRPHANTKWRSDAESASAAAASSSSAIYALEGSVRRKRGLGRVSATGYVFAFAFAHLLVCDVIMNRSPPLRLGVRSLV